MYNGNLEMRSLCMRNCIEVQNVDGEGGSERGEIKIYEGKLCV